MVGKELDSFSNETKFQLFDSTVKNMLNRQAPLKKKYLRANDGPYMTKQLRKAIMTRSRLKSIFNRTRANENWIAYKSKETYASKSLVKIGRHTMVNWIQKWSMRTKIPGRL